MMPVTSLNGIVRVVFAGIIGAAGIGLVVYSAVVSKDTSQTALGVSMIAGSGLTAWDARI